MIDHENREGKKNDNKNCNFMSVCLFKVKI